MKIKEGIMLLDKDGKVWRELSEEDDLQSYNCFNGCRFDCYDGKCWAAIEAKRQQEFENRGYENGFQPSFIEEKLERSEWKSIVRSRDYIWIGDMGDLACQSENDIKRVIDRIIRPNPSTIFFLETKNPDSYNRFIDDLPENVLLSTTIETNRGYGYGKEYNVSNAPEPKKRFEDFRVLDWPRKHVSIEPVMKFDLDIFVNWLRKIDPEMVWVGFANYGIRIPEPSFDEVLELLWELADFTRVEPKDNVVEELSNEQLQEILDKGGWEYRNQTGLGVYGI